MELPNASVQAYHPDYITWEKLTALHQFCTQAKHPDASRLSRHWYDVDCILNDLAEGTYQSNQAMRDVVEMKSARWVTRGVSFEEIFSENLVLIPSGDLLQNIRNDFARSVTGGMFFTPPDNFEEIIERLDEQQTLINEYLKELL